MSALSEQELAWAEHYLPIFSAEASFHEFAKQAWIHIEGPKVPFKDGWHIQAICEHLEAVARRDIKNLIINIPPRCMKSSLVAVMWPAWVWLHAPHEKFMYASHKLNLSRRDSLKCKRLIDSHWYRSRWEHIYRITKDQNAKDKFENDKKGYRMIASIGSGSTGEGGNFLIADDANNASDSNPDSSVTRDTVNEWFDQEFSNRLNDSARDAIIIIQQRFNEEDLTGHILNKEDADEYVKLILPMEFERDRRAKTIILPSTNGKEWQDPRKEEGELLWPEGKSAAVVSRDKKKLGSSYRIAGQFQQRPSPGEGGIIKMPWFKLWRHLKPPENITQVIQSWDTALEGGENAADSACTTWGLFMDDSTGLNNMILLGMWRGKLYYPELRKRAIKLYQDYRDDDRAQFVRDEKHVPDLVIIEAKASGHSLVSDLQRAGINVVKFNPTRYGDKDSRVELSTYMIEGGRVWVPAKPPNFIYPRDFAKELMDLACAFPAAKSRDVVDSMTQAILRLRGSGYLPHMSDDKEVKATKSSHGFYGPDTEMDR